MVEHATLGCEFKPHSGQRGEKERGQVGKDGERKDGREGGRKNRLNVAETTTTKISVA